MPTHPVALSPGCRRRAQSGRRPGPRRSGPVEIVGSSAVLATGSLASLASGDVIDLTDLAAANAIVSGGSGLLRASDGPHPVSIPVAGPMLESDWSVTPDPYGGLLLHLT